MSKRFTDTKIWEEDWFLELPKDYKTFWFYMKDKCDHAGMFKVNVKVFNAVHEAQVDSEIAFELFNKGKKRLRRVNGSMWLIEDFFKFQYGEILNQNNSVHRSIKEVYDKNEVELRSIRGLKEVKEWSKRPLDKG